MCSGFTRFEVYRVQGLGLEVCCLSQVDDAEECYDDASLPCLTVTGRPEQKKASGFVV